MKTPLLVLLTVVNSFWSTGLFFRPSPSPQPGESPVVLREDAHGNPAGRPATDRHASNASPALVETQPFDWRCVESTDYRHYLKNLRAIGCPEMTIRDLITADVRSLFRQRREALLAQESVRFWTASYGQEEATPAWQALAREEDFVLQELLGRDYPAATAAGPAEESEPSLRLGAGLESKRAALESWRDHFAKAGEELQARASERELTSSEEARVVQLEQEMDQALGAILTPEEKEEFNVRNSPLAQDLRESLLGFEVSEAEFRSLLRARQQAEAEVAQRVTDGTGDVADLGRQRQDAAQALLGPDRFRLYERAQLPEFRALFQQGRNEGWDGATLEAAWTRHQAEEASHSP